MKPQSLLPVLIKNIALVTLAFLGGYYFTKLFHEPTSLVGGMWCVISAIIVIESSHSETFVSARNRILGTIVGALVSGSYLFLFPFSVIGFAGAIGIGVLICYLFRIPKAVKLTGITIAVVIIVATIDKDLHPFVNAGLRLAESAIGTGMAVIVALVSYFITEHTTKTKVNAGNQGA